MPTAATFFTLLMVALILGGLIYAGIVLWPQRIPKDRSVDGIKERIDAEQQGGN